MFKMVEVVGASPAGFSEAVKAAVNELKAAGEKVHFFEVIEQRGAVRDGIFKEYQVKLKVGVEMAVSAGTKADSAACPTCLQPAGESGHLCVPVGKSAEKCEWCGSLIPDERHLCNDKIKEIAFICNSCGRTAVKPEHLCQPKKIGKKK